MMDKIKKLTILVLAFLSLQLEAFSNTDPILNGSDALAGGPGQRLRVATFNIRSYHGSDSQNWETRLASLDSLFRMYDFDIVGVQEPYQPQIEELVKSLDNIYDYYVVHTGNLNSRGLSHSNPVLFRKDRFKLLDSGVFWFSEQPETPASVSWNASQARNCVWVHLLDKKNKTDLYVFNSHFDHKSALARDNSANLLLRKVKEIAGKNLVICTGDFNSRQTTDSYKTLSNSILQDTHAIAKRVENDDYRTSHGYKVYAPGPGSPRIDHIFISNKVKRRNVLFWKVCNEMFDGNWASDHFPVFVDLDLEGILRK